MHKKQKLPSKHFSGIIKLMVAGILVFLVYIQVGVGIVDYIRMVHQDYSTQLILRPFLFNCIFSLAFFLLYVSQNKAIRWFSYCFTFATFSLFIIYQKLHGSGLDFNTGLGFEVNDANTILIEMQRSGAVDAAMSSYSYVICYGMLIALAYTMLIWLIVKLSGVRIGKYYTSLIPIVVLSILYIEFNHSKASIANFPVVVKVPFQFYAAATLPVYRGKRASVTWHFNAQKQVNKLVFIVDESVRGDVLSINGFKIETTPYLQQIKSCIFNYGIATSSGNCSASSHIMLQTGIRPNQMHEMAIRLFKNPSIFQFAKHAGYKTIYIDGQTMGSLLQNYLRSSDFESIDKTIQIRSKYPNVTHPEIDFKISEEIIRLLKENTQEKLFIYVIKSGIHFPYEKSIIQVDPGIAKTFVEDKNSDDAVDQLRLNYYSSTKWNVDHFFNTLLPQIAQYNPIIIYTSDHGQVLREQGILATHCIVNNIVYQGIVPLIIFALGDSYTKFLSLAKNNFLNNYNKASHFNIFPTILLLFGYSEKDIAQYYEPSLFDKLNGKRIFYTGVAPGNPDYYETKVDNTTIQRNFPAAIKIPTSIVSEDKSSCVDLIKSH